jgi:diketogulonate reductase-like aldo/keto reductase
MRSFLEGCSTVFFQIELHPYVWKANKTVVEFGKKHGIVTAAFGGLTPIVRAPEGPLTDVLTAIRERLEKTYGKAVTPGQVLTKWIMQKGAIVIT